MPDVEDRIDEVLPWHAEQWRQLLAALRAGRLPHALLLHGPQGMGKRAFAGRLVRTLLCASPGEAGAACDRCRSCQLHAAGNHPDYQYLTLLVEDGKQRRDIAIDQVRGLIDFMALTSSFAGRKVVLIEPAERMNRNAANALLKVLEEPPGEAVLVLVSSRPTALPVTVRSRCRQLAFSRPPEDLAAGWLAAHGQSPGDARQLLAVSGGAPLAALEHGASGLLASRKTLLDDLRRLVAGGEDPVEVAERWLAPGDANRLLEAMETLINDLVCLKYGLREPYIANRDLLDGLHALAKTLDLDLLFRLLDGLSVIWRARDGAARVKDESLLTDIAMRWAWAGKA